LRWAYIENAPIIRFYSNGRDFQKGAPAPIRRCPTYIGIFNGKFEGRSQGVPQFIGAPLT